MKECAHVYSFQVHMNEDKSKVYTVEFPEHGEFDEDNISMIIHKNFNHCTECGEAYANV